MSNVLSFQKIHRGKISPPFDRFLGRLEQELDITEIRLLDTKVKPAEEVEVYVKYLYNVVYLAFKPNEALSCCIFRGLKGISKAVSRIERVKTEKKPLLVSVETQTDTEEIKIPIERRITQDLEELDACKKNTEDLSIEKVVELLDSLYLNLRSMRTEIPEPTSLPDMSFGQVKELSKELERSFRVIKQEIAIASAPPELISRIKLNKSVQASIVNSSTDKDRYLKLLQEKELEILNLSKRHRGPSHEFRIEIMDCLLYTSPSPRDS